MDHRHSVDGLIEIFDDRLRPDQGDALVGVDHDRRFAGGVEVDELVAALPRVLAHQLRGDSLLGQDEPDLARKGTQRELEELPHGAGSFSGGERLRLGAQRQRLG